MFEKVNPKHPDKLADRIVGAIVDLAYEKEDNPKIAVEVLIGHGSCHIIAESSAELDTVEVCKAVHRIAGNNLMVNFRCVNQDAHLADNQADGFRCGDNGIFKGMPITDEQKALCEIAKDVYNTYPYDGKYILDQTRLIICQSNADTSELKKLYPSAEVNPIGDWTGGTDVDTGATNRKLGSDMADSVTGGGLHGKDLSKADVSVNIYAFLKAQETHKPVELCCAIGDETIDGKPYSEIDVLNGIIRKSINENAQKTLDQDEYNKKYKKYDEQYQKLKSRIKSLKNIQHKRQMQHAAIGAFMFEVLELSELPATFDEKLWTVSIEKAIVYKDGRIVFSFINGAEIEA